MQRRRDPPRRQNEGSINHRVAKTNVLQSTAAPMQRPRKTIAAPRQSFGRPVGGQDEDSVDYHSARRGAEAKVLPAACQTMAGVSPRVILKTIGACRA